MTPLQAPTVLLASHDTASFNCGSAPLDDYLKKNALHSQNASQTRTYVITRAARVVAYYTIVFGSVSPSETPRRVSQGLGQYPVPILLLARLAVDRSEQGQGLGKELLRDAFRKAIIAADVAGLRAMFVQAKDDAARDFYLRFGFEPSPGNPLHLYLLTKDIKKSIAAASGPPTI